MNIIIQFKFVSSNYGSPVVRILFYQGLYAKFDDLFVGCEIATFTLCLVLRISFHIHYITGEMLIPKCC